MEHPTLTHYSTRVLSPDPAMFPPPIAAILARNILIQRETILEITGVQSSVPLALMRTICGELPVLRLTSTYEAICTTDPHIIPTHIVRRLEMIPVMQSIPRDITYTLTAHNTTLLPLDVLSAALTPSRGTTQYFNPTYVICTLSPNHSINIAATVLEIHPHMSDHSSAALATAGRSIPLDVRHYDPAHPQHGGTQSAASDPRHFRIGFSTNGDIMPLTLIKLAIANIITRVRSVETLLSRLTSPGREYVLILPGESYSLGELFTQAISLLYPTINCVAYEAQDATGDLRIRALTDTDFEPIVIAAISHICATYTQILAQLDDQSD